MTNFENDQITYYYFAECFFGYIQVLARYITDNLIQQNNQCKLNKCHKIMFKKCVINDKFDIFSCKKFVNFSHAQKKMTKLMTSLGLT